MAQQTTPQSAENQTSDPSDGSWLTAKEVIDNTGIAKADLLQFIQLNVLPKSMMRVMSTGHDAPRKKSYFSSTVLGHVAMLKMLRDEGHSVDTIARQLGQAQDHARDALAQQAPELRPDEPSVEKAEDQTAPVYFSFPASAITGSAFFVNQKMTIGWIKVARDDSLFKTIHAEMDDDPSGTVFDILLRASLKELVFNWQPLFSFIYRFLEDITAPDVFKRAAPMVSLHLEGIHHPKMFMDRPPKGRPRIDSCPIRLEDEKGRLQTMRLYAMALSDGALFVFEKEHWHNAYGGITDALPISDTPTAATSVDGKTPFSVISARLENSQRLVDTLLPETYYALINHIWDESDRIVDAYGGQRARRSGTEVQYIIPRHAGTDPSYDAIRCAIELRKKVRQIEGQMKKDGSWFSDIRLNIGISSGKDHLPAQDLTDSIAFMLPGGAADQAFHLSTIAQGGNILITKSAFGHLSPRQMKSITFGIYREKRLIPKIFAQLSDLAQGTGTPPMAQEIRSLFATYIVDLNVKYRHTQGG